MSDVIKILHKATLNHGNALARELAINKINQGNQAGINWFGEKINHIGASNFGGVPYSVDTLLFDARILIVHYIPSLGGTLGEEKAAEAFTRMYNAMVGTAYTTTEFGRADLQKHTAIGEGFVTLLDRIDRYLDSFNLVEYANKAPQWLKDNLFKNANNASYADLVAKRNLLVPYLNKLILPSNIPSISRHRALCRNIYVDDVHDKTQLIICESDVHYLSILANGDAGCVQITSARNIDDLLDLVYNALKTYVESAFYNSISPYLYRAMLDPNGPKIAKAYDFLPYDAISKPKTTLEAIYDIELIQMIRNGDFIGSLFNSFASDVENSNLNISEDNDGVCRQGRVSSSQTGMLIRPIAVQVASTASVNPDTMGVGLLSSETMDVIYPIADEDHLLNMEDFPTPDDAMYVAMNGLVVTSRALTGTSKFKYILYSGDLIFTRLEFVVVNSTNGTNVVNRVAGINYSAENAVSAADKKVVFSGYISNLCGNGESEAFYNAAFQKIGSLASFACCPHLYTLYLDFNANIYKLFANFKDIDNLVRVTRPALINYCMFNIFDNYNMTGTGESKSRPSRSDKPKHNKGKGKSGEADKDKEVK